MLQPGRAGALRGAKRGEIWVFHLCKLPLTRCQVLSRWERDYPVKYGGVSKGIHPVAGKEWLWLSESRGPGSVPGDNIAGCRGPVIYPVVFVPGGCGCRPGVVMDRSRNLSAALFWGFSRVLSQLSAAFWLSAPC